MNKNKTGLSAASTTKRPTSSSTAYRVGYGKPPVEHRFKPGQSGNRLGRPKGSKNTATELADVLKQKVELRAGGSVRKVSLRRAIFMRQAQAAATGDVRAAKFLFELEQQLKPSTKDQLQDGLKTAEDIKAALAARGLPESTLQQLEFHDPEMLGEAERED